MKKIVVAPDFYNLAETHRMISFVEAFCKKDWDVYVIGEGPYDSLLGELKVIRKYVAYDENWFTPEKYVTMHSIDEAGFDYFSVDDLISFVEQEKVIISEIQPDVILTGYRLTMSLTARLLGIPIVWVMSAVLSDMYFQKRLATMPHGHVLMSTLIKSLRPEEVDEFFCKNALKMSRGSKNWKKCAKHYNIKPFKSDIEIFRGDYNIMADCPFLFSEFGTLPVYYDFCGPLLFEYKQEIPKSVITYKKGKRPTIFFCMGSSGNPEICRNIIFNLCRLTAFDVFIAGSNLVEKEELKELPDNIIVERMLPIPEVAAVSDVTIIHGGQGTLYATIMSGVPFVGIPFFCEQQYNLETFERAGCGKVLMKNCSFEDIMSAVHEVLEQKSYKMSAQNTGNKIKQYIDEMEYTAGEYGANGIIKFLEQYTADQTISYFHD